MQLRNSRGYQVMKDQTKVLLCVSEPRGRAETGWWEAGYDR